jgi:hypothetical protein
MCYGKQEQGKLLQSLEIMEGKEFAGHQLLPMILFPIVNWAYARLFKKLVVTIHQEIPLFS